MNPHTCQFAAQEILKALKPSASSRHLASNLEHLNRQFKAAEKLKKQGKNHESAKAFHKITSEGIQLFKKQKINWLRRLKQDLVPIRLLERLHAQSKIELEAIRHEEEKKSLELEALKATFDAAWYLDTYADVQRAGIDPWTHFITHGLREGRAACHTAENPSNSEDRSRTPATPTALFDEVWYCAKYPKFMSSRKKPREIWMDHGWPVGHSPSMYFDTAWYVAQVPDFASEASDPLEHYLHIGYRAGLSPSPFFDVAWYFEQYPQVKALGVEPVQHYLEEGWRLGYSPSPFLDGPWYAETYQVTSTSPLTHFISRGKAEGKRPNPNFLQNYERLQNITGFDTYYPHTQEGLLKFFEPNEAHPIDLSAFNDDTEHIIFVSHAANFTGAPLAMIETAKQIMKHTRIVPWFVVVVDGPDLGTYVSMGPTLLVKKVVRMIGNEDGTLEKVAHFFATLPGKKVSLLNSFGSMLILPHLHRAKIKNLAWIHEMPFSLGNHPLSKAWIHHLVTCCEKVIFPARVVESQNREAFNFPESYTSVIKYGVDHFGTKSSPAPFDLSTLNIPDDAPVVVSCAKGDLRKGLDLYVLLIERILRRYREKAPNAPLPHFIWAGELFLKLDSWARYDAEKLGIEKQIHFTGLIENIPSLYQRASVLLFPSREDPAPIAIIEALYNGLPVVAFERALGSPEYSPIGIELVPYLDIDAAATITADILTDQLYPTEKRQEISNYVKENLKWRQCAQEWWEYLAPVLGSQQKFELEDKS